MEIVNERVSDFQNNELVVITLNSDVIEEGNIPSTSVVNIPSNSNNKNAESRNK